jgi:transposase
VGKERRHLVYEVVRRHSQGESQRSIGRALSIAPKTVRRILGAQNLRRSEGESSLERALPPQRTPRASKLDEYEEQIEAWLEEYENLTAVRLFEKLQEAGFEGRYTIVRLRLKALRAKREPKVAVQVVETPPGQQGQFDWSPYKLEGGLTVQLWSCTLSWSRGRAFLSSDNTRQTTIFNCLKQSFERFGGVPFESVTDSMPGVVDRWECGRPILNVCFVDFAAYYAFAVHIAPRGDGAYKGKVERPFRYVEENLLNGRRFHSLEEFAEVLAWWTQERAMKRPHPVTGRPLWQMLEEERPHLKPLPAHPYDTREVVIRLVDSRALVQYETNLYPVPEELIGDLVYVCVGPERIEVFDGGVHRMAELERLPDGAGQQHPGSPDRARRGRFDVTLLAARLAAWGPVGEDFARNLRTRKRYAGAQMNHILGLQVTWSADDIVKALQHAIQYDAYDARAVERILEARFAPRTFDAQIAESTRGRIREVMKDHPVGVRPLTSYDTLRTGDVVVPEEEDDRGDPTPDEDKLS